MAPTLDFRVLGPLEVRATSRPGVTAGDTAGDQALDLAGPRQRAVLAALLMELGHVVSVDRLIDQLWGGEPPAAAIGSLQAYVSNLRRVLEPERAPRSPARVLVSQPPGYVLRVDGDQVDAVRFERRLAHAQEMLDGGHPSTARRVAAEALRLWRGPAYADFTFEPFAQAAIARLEELRLAAEEVHAEALLRSGDTAAPAAVAHMERLVAEHPLRERFRELLVWALYRSGRQAEALRQIDAARALLREELGVDPGPGLTRLEAQVLDHDPALGLGLVPPSSPRPAALPSAGIDDRPFVGRRAELDVVRAAWAGAAAGRTQAVVLTGEAGVGKTRMAEELAAVAAKEGARVAWARCYEDSGAAALGPWSSLLEMPVLDDAADPAAARLGRTRALTRMVDELVAMSRDQPTVAVVDDLQWADRGSLDLLDLAVRARSEVPLLLVATVRTPAPDEVVDLLGRLARYDHVHRIDLPGLDADDVAALGVDEATARQVHDRTGGNAFFVVETLRLLATRPGDAATDLPGSVVDVVRGRVARLPDATRALLSEAAVVGHSFTTDDIDALEPALLAQLVIEDDDTPGGFRFAHPIVQEALYASLTPTAAAREHRRVADRLAARNPDPIEVAHHYSRAAAAGTPPEAAAWASRAAAIEEARLAFPEAAVWRERAVALHDRAGNPADATRHALLVELGRSLWLAGDLARSQDVLADALALAQQLGDPEAVVATATRTVTFTPWGWWRPGGHDPRIVAALEGALAAGELAPASAVRARAQLAVELTIVPGRADGAVAHAAQAIEAARATGDQLVLAQALQAQVLVGWRPDGPRLQLPAAEEMATMPQVEVSVVGRLVAASARLALGDQTGFDDEIEACWRLAEPTSQPALRVPVALARVTAALLRGDLDAADDLSRAAYALYDELGFPGREDIRAAQLLEIARARGDVAVHAEELRDLAGRALYPHSADLLAGMVALELGDRDSAASALRRSPDLPIQADFTWLYMVSLQVELAAATGSRQAERYRTALRPYADQHVVLATAAVHRGPVANFLT